MSRTEHLDAPAMMKALETLRPSKTRVIYADCRLCDTPLVIAGVPRKAQAALPYTPNKSPWRAFERDHRVPGGWRSSKRFGFIPNKRDELGFEPHDCPRADWKGAATT